MQKGAVFAPVFHLPTFPLLSCITNVICSATRAAAVEQRGGYRMQNGAVFALGAFLIASPLQLFTGVI